MGSVHHMRIEHDSMGEVEVPDDARWGAQTQRALDNFPISGEPLDRRLIAALAAIKGASATVNGRLGVVDKTMAKAIHDAAVEVSRGDHDEHFPIDVFQTGSGTSSNMNMNEVLASLASERLGSPGSVHPNDDVNASQSSNDVFPSAIHLAAVRTTVVDLLPSLDRLITALRKKSREFATIVKSGRTHLMDATPVTLGQEFGGYATQVKDARDRIEAALPAVGVLPLGGTAVGTGINAPKTFARSVIKRLADDMGLPLVEAKDHFAAQGARDALVGLSGDLRVLTVALVKIANDIRWMGSGPRAGLAEIRIPDLQPGSSIMPGKVNPGRVRGGDAGVRASLGKRRRRRVRRVAGQLRAQRVPPRDRPQLAGVDPPARERHAPVRRPVRVRHRGERRPAAALRRVEPVDRHRAQPVHRLREGGRVGEEVDQHRPVDP